MLLLISIGFIALFSISICREINYSKYLYMGSNAKTALHFEDFANAFQYYREWKDYNDENNIHSSGVDDYVKYLERGRHPDHPDKLGNNRNLLLYRINRWAIGTIWFYAFSNGDMIVVVRCYDDVGAVPPISIAIKDLKDTTIYDELINLCVKWDYDYGQELDPMNRIVNYNEYINVNINGEDIIGYQTSKEYEPTPWYTIETKVKEAIITIFEKGREFNINELKEVIENGDRCGSNVEREEIKNPLFNSNGLPDVLSLINTDYAKCEYSKAINLLSQIMKNDDA